MSEKMSLLLVVVALWLAHPCEGSDPDAEVVTQRLVIVDAENRPRIIAEGGTAPRLVFRSESGKELIRIAIGGDDKSFPFDQKDVPHLTLETETANTELTLSVATAPHVDGLDEQFLTESAFLFMRSSQEMSGGPTAKFLNVGIFPNKAVLSIASETPEHPLGVFDPDVRLIVDPKGDVTTYLGPDEEEDR